MPDHVKLEVTFLTPDQGGRDSPFALNGFRPHLRVPPDDNMLGVEFVGSDTVVPVGNPVSVLAKLVYAPAVSYAVLHPGAWIEVLDGSRVVGHGHVIGMGSRPNNSFKPKPLRGSA
jgi:hypothetical protein